MSSEFSTLFLGLWLLVVGMFAYAAFWALSIRRVLVPGLYRKQAFWVGAMAVYFVALSAFLSVALSLSLSGLIVDVAGASIITFGFTLIFLWIDSTVRIARRSDPLFRDTLRWSVLRYFFWLVTLGGAFDAFYTAITSGFAASTPFGGAILFGAIALFISGRRSGDVTLRRHLRWTGLCILMLWLASQIQLPLSSRIDPYLAQSVTWPLVAIGAYALYRSAKSLVPLEHLKDLETSALIAPASTNPVQ